MSPAKTAPTPATLAAAAQAQPDGPNVAPSAHEHEAAQGRPDARDPQLAQPQADGSAGSSGSDGGTGSDPAREARIREMAYALAAERGFAPGQEVDDWLEAERRLGVGGGQALP